MAQDEMGMVNLNSLFILGIRRFGYAQTNLKPPSSSDSDSNLSPSYYKDLEKLGKERSWIFLEKDIEPTNSTAFGDHIKSGDEA